MLTDEQKKVAKMILEREAFKIGAFRLKLHDTNPDAPLSPFYLNLRDRNNPKPGPLETADYDLVVKAMYAKIMAAGLSFDAIAGIPNAGGPFARAFIKLIGNNFRLIELKKVEFDGKRRIIPATGFSYTKGEKVLLIDDLITHADTKLEAIKAVEDSGLIMVGVAVLIDRLGGGREELERAGYRLFFSFTILDLLNFYLEERLIQPRAYASAYLYVENQQALA